MVWLWLRKNDEDSALRKWKCSVIPTSQMLITTCSNSPEKTRQVPHLLEPSGHPEMSRGLREMEGNTDHHNPLHFTCEETGPERRRGLLTITRKERSWVRTETHIFELSTQCWFFFPTVWKPGALSRAEVSPGNISKPGWVPNLSTDPCLWWSEALSAASVIFKNF